MRSTVILAALCAVLLASSADARPRQTTSIMSMSRPIHPGIYLESGKPGQKVQVRHAPAGRAKIGRRRLERRPRHHLVGVNKVIEGGLLNFEPSFARHPKQLISRRNRRKTGHLVTTHRNTIRPMPSGLHRVMATGAGRVVAHPYGCPRRAFCGCGAAVHRFGRPIRSLWLARNWFRFPRAAPAPGMAAVRRHHVFILKRHVRGPVWVAYDANSGGHRTRIHPRSIAGWTIVNPRGM